MAQDDKDNRCLLIKLHVSGNGRDVLVRREDIEAAGFFEVSEASMVRALGKAWGVTDTINWKIFAKDVLYELGKRKIGSSRPKRKREVLENKLDIAL